MQDFNTEECETQLEAILESMPDPPQIMLHVATQTQHTLQQNTRVEQPLATVPQQQIPVQAMTMPPQQMQTMLGELPTAPIPQQQIPVQQMQTMPAEQPTAPIPQQPIPVQQMHQTPVEQPPIQVQQMQTMPPQEQIPQTQTVQEQPAPVAPDPQAQKCKEVSALGKQLQAWSLATGATVPKSGAPDCSTHSQKEADLRLPATPQHQVTNNELAALGWLQPQGVPKKQQKQIALDFIPTPELPKAQAPPQMVGQIPKATSPKVKEELKEPVKCYSRRAAANLVARLSENPSRVAKMPQLKALVFDPERKSELITLLCENAGEIERAQASLQLQEESGKSLSTRKRALRLTKKQMEDTYGADAASVMAQKEADGLTEEDENFVGGKVYLFVQREEEDERFVRSSPLSEGVCLAAID